MGNNAEISATNKAQEVKKTSSDQSNTQANRNDIGRPGADSRDASSVSTNVRSDLRRSADAADCLS